MDAHHEQRVRQLLSIENDPETGARGVIPPAAVAVINRVEKMLVKRTASSLRASEIAVLLAAAGVGPEEAKAAQAKVEPEIKPEPVVKPEPEMKPEPVKRGPGRPRKT